AEDGIRDRNVTGVQTCALPILSKTAKRPCDVLAPRGRFCWQEPLPVRSEAVEVVRGVVALGAVAALGGSGGQHLQQLAELLGVGAVVVLVGFAVHRAAGADGGQLAVILPLELGRASCREKCRARWAPAAETGTRHGRGRPTRRRKRGTRGTEHDCESRDSEDR